MVSSPTLPNNRPLAQSTLILRPSQCCVLQSWVSNPHQLHQRLPHRHLVPTRHHPQQPTLANSSKTSCESSATSCLATQKRRPSSTSTPLPPSPSSSVTSHQLQSASTATTHSPSTPVLKSHSATCRTTSDVLQHTKPPNCLLLSAEENSVTLATATSPSVTAATASST